MTAAPVLARTLKFTVTISKGEGAGKILSFEKSVVTIGRGPENDLVFANDPKMSRTHAEFRVQMGQLYMRNLSEKNFILVNGEKIDEKLLSGTNEIQIGETVLFSKTEPAPPILNHLILTTPNPIAGVQASIGAKKNHPAGLSSPQSATSQRTDFRTGNPSGVVAGQVGLLGNKRFRFYSTVIILGGLGWWFLSSGTNHKKQEINLRTEGDVARIIEDSANAVRELKKQQQNSGQDSLQYKAAQEHYVKGFRDYRQGQYARAIQSFQAALSFYPNHELARKYWVQSQRKFDEMVNQNMSQGRKYYQKNNFKMCQSAFANVMIMVKDSAKPKYKEAKQFYEECSLRAEGRY